jgi:serine/threonine-protein kinase RsbW
VFQKVEITFSLRLPRDAATVPFVRTICWDSMKRLGVTSTCQEDVALAVTEACANVVRHAGEISEYHVEVLLSEQWCHIRVIDTGQGIDVEALTRAMPKAGDDAGRGLVLMRLLVDRIDFESHPEAGTVVHLRKRLDFEDGSAMKELSLGSTR